MRFLTKICVLLFAFSLITLSCSTGDLTRSTASSKISQSKEFLGEIYRLQWERDGVSAWKNHGSWHNPKLIADFASASDKPGDEYLQLKSPTKRVLGEVNGIAAVPMMGEGMREVQFTWAYSPISKIAKRYVAVEGTGTALFRKYDDGWRIEEMRVVQSSNPPKYSDAEAAEIQAEVAAEVSRRNAEKAEAEQQAAARKQRLEESKRPTRQLWSGFTVSGGLVGGKTLMPASMSDVSVTSHDWAYSNSSPHETWFGRIKQIDFTQGNSTWAPSVMIWYYEYGSDKLPFQKLDEAKAFYSALVAAHAAWWKRYGDDVRAQGR